MVRIIRYRGFQIVQDANLLYVIQASQFKDLAYVNSDDAIDAIDGKNPPVVRTGGFPRL